MTHEQLVKNIKEVLESEYWDRAYWRAHPTHFISPVEGMHNRDETELKITALEYYLKDIEELVKQEVGKKQFIIDLNASAQTYD